MAPPRSKPGILGSRGVGRPICYGEFANFAQNAGGARDDPKRLKLQQTCSNNAGHISLDDGLRLVGLSPLVASVSESASSALPRPPSHGAISKQQRHLLDVLPKDEHLRNSSELLQAIDCAKSGDSTSSSSGLMPHAVGCHSFSTSMAHVIDSSDAGHASYRAKQACLSTAVPNLISP